MVFVTRTNFGVRGLVTAFCLSRIVLHKRKAVIKSPHSKLNASVTQADSRD
jgi:hypothetical protein